MFGKPFLREVFMNMDFGFLTYFVVFYMYCFLGWCFESTYVSIGKRKWVNRGFMKGPFLPIYGSGAVTILFVTAPVVSNPVLVYILSVAAATVLELVTGVVMEKLFKIRYWDYSKDFMNYKGYICLKSSIVWGFMGLLATYVINEPAVKIINSVPVFITGILVLVITVIFVVDFAGSFRAAYNLREIILNNAKLMKELNDIKLEITAAIDEKRTELNEKKEAMVSEIKDKIETALSYTEIDDVILEKIGELKNLDIEEYISKWQDKATQLREKIKAIDKSKINLLKRNPSAKSRFGFLKEIKENNKK